MSIDDLPLPATMAAVVAAMTVLPGKTVLVTMIVPGTTTARATTTVARLLLAATMTAVATTTPLLVATMTAPGARLAVGTMTAATTALLPRLIAMGKYHLFVTDRGSWITATSGRMRAL